MAVEKGAGASIKTEGTALDKGKNPHDFQQALLSAYLQDPCGVLPGPIWRYFDMTEQADTDFSIDNGQVSYLKLQRGRRLMLCWYREQAYSLISDEELTRIDYAVLHQDQIENFDTASFDHTPYFRMITRRVNFPQVEPPAGFVLKNANPLDEAGLINEMLSLCYSDDHPAPETILSWSSHPVFEPDLWLLMMDAREKSPVGLAVAEYDRRQHEGIILWAQVVPGYQGKGLGKTLVLELMRRLQGRAKFTTVSGQQYNDTRPDILFRKAGFSGDDIWWIMRRKGN